MMTGMDDALDQQDIRLHGSFRVKIIRRVAIIVMLPTFLLTLAFFVGWNRWQEASAAAAIVQRGERLAQSFADEIDAWAGLLSSAAAEPSVRALLSSGSAPLDPAVFERLYAAVRARGLKGILSGIGGPGGGWSFSTWRVPDAYAGGPQPGWGPFVLADSHPGAVAAYRERLGLGPGREAVLSLVLRVDVPGPPAYLVANLDEASFLEAFRAQGDGVSTKFFLTTGHDRVVCAQDRSYADPYGTFRVPDSRGRVELEESAFVYVRAPVGGWDLQLTGISSVEGLRESFRLGVLTIVGLMVAGALVLSIVLAISLGRVTRPLRAVLVTMERVSKGDLKARMAVASGDEFERIALRFNGIVAEMEEMVKRQMAQVELVKTAEMKQLQAQLNPHFLYNTLDAASWMVQMGEKDKGLAILSDMGKVLRYSLERRKSEMLVPLREDLRIIRTYLHIHELCLGERLRVVYDIDEAALDLPVPRLLLQPVIENAVVHGIAEAAAGTITIGVRRLPGLVEVTIADTGKGFAVRRGQFDLDPVAAETDEGRSHLGLALVFRRAALHFGERHTLDIHSEPGSGTRVTLRVRLGGED